MNNDINSLKNKIDLCDRGTFVKFDSEYFIDLSIGKNYENEYCFVVRGQTHRINFLQTDIISLDLQIVNKNMKQLVFSLKDQKFLDVFLKLIYDMYEALINRDINPIEDVYRRWILWRELFSINKKEMLSEIEIQGLLGELYFLYDYMIDKYGVNDAILSWGGINYNRKDFEINSIWYEIKTTLKYRAPIIISSLYQLESSDPGILVLYDLDKSTCTNLNSYNINKIINLVLKKVHDSYIYDLLIKKLDKKNYIYKKEYEDFNYIITNKNYYSVEDNFPKLTKNNTPFGIIECKYSIDYMEIDRFKIEI